MTILLKKELIWKLWFCCMKKKSLMEDKRQGSTVIGTPKAHPTNACVVK